jgi:WD40 repeat protein
VSPRLVRSLVHPDRTASVLTVRYSADGARLFTAGYPSGIAQVWDAASGKELRKVESPRPPGSTDYTALSADWATMYIPLEKRKATLERKDGQRTLREEFSGEVMVWDLATGKPRSPLRVEPSRGVFRATLSPDNTLLLTVETMTDSRRKTYLWDLRTRTCRKFLDSYCLAAFAPDGRTVAAAVNHYEPQAGTVRLLDFPSGRELARCASPEKDRILSVPVYSPDGKVLAVPIGGKKDAPPTLLFLDARTLEVRGTLAAPAQEGKGWLFDHRFSPDGRYLAACDRSGTVYLWDVAAMKLARTWTVGPKSRLSSLAFSPDGRRLAVIGQPAWDEREAGDDPDPQDLPQPRVYLFETDSDHGPEVLVCPHGYRGRLAFSPDGKTLAVGGAGAVHLFDVSRPAAGR